MTLENWVHNLLQPLLLWEILLYWIWVEMILVTTASNISPKQATCQTSKHFFWMIARLDLKVHSIWQSASTSESWSISVWRTISLRIRDSIIWWYQTTFEILWNCWWHITKSRLMEWCPLLIATFSLILSTWTCKKMRLVMLEHKLLRHVAWRIWSLWTLDITKSVMRDTNASQMVKTCHYFRHCRFILGMKQAWRPRRAWWEADT